MEFHVGDKIVHPRHGPGRITGLERKEFIAEAKRYFIIEIPSTGLTVYVPRKKMEQIGVRPVIRQARIKAVFKTLMSSPRPLPSDYKERQEQVWELLSTGEMISIAEAVRDLTWHEQRDHLTRKDSDYLRRGRELLAAEMALASDSEIGDVNTRIEAALVAAMASASRSHVGS
jgi:CarD family transcriptional regulator